MLLSPVYLGDVVRVGGGDSALTTAIYSPPSALCRMLECASSLPVERLVVEGLFDLRGFDATPPVRTHLVIDGEPAGHYFATFRVGGGASTLTPLDLSQRDYWQRSMSAWLSIALLDEGIRCARVRVGWPVPLRTARMQLMKLAMREVLEGLPPELRAAYVEGEIGWEPGSVLLRPGAFCDLEGCVLDVPDFGMPEEHARYAAAQVLLSARALRLSGEHPR